MKKLQNQKNLSIVLSFIFFAVSTSGVLAQSLIAYESFEGTAGELGYTTTQWRDGFSDYSHVVNYTIGGNPAPANGFHIFAQVVNVHDDGTGEQHWFAVDDLDDNGNPRSDDNSVVSFKTIDVSGYTDLEVRLRLGVGRPFRFETTDRFQIYYAFDADTSAHPDTNTAFTQGSYTLLASYRGSGTSTTPSLDADNNGIGDGLVVLDTGLLREYTYSISATGNKLSIRILADCNSGDEEWLYDYMQVWGTAGSTPVSASISSQTNVSCNGESTGSLTATATDGTANYSYTWSNGATTNNTASTTNTINGLAAGTYTVTITDNNGTTATASTTVTEAATLSSGTVQTN